MARTAAGMVTIIRMAMSAECGGIQGSLSTIWNLSLPSFHWMRNWKDNTQVDGTRRHCIIDRSQEDLLNFNTACRNKIREKDFLGQKGVASSPPAYQIRGIRSSVLMRIPFVTSAI